MEDTTFLLNMREKNAMLITIDNRIKAINPNLGLGVVCAQISVSGSSEVIIAHMRDLEKDVSHRMDLDSLKILPQVSAVNEMYKKMGKDPSRYRGSAESLIRRIISGKNLYQINNVVDINNIISLETLHPVGSYDLDQLHGSIRFTIGDSDDSYKGIGKDVINTKDLPVFKDDIGAYGSPTSDSTRAMIKNTTQRVMMVIISFDGSGLREGIEKVKKYLIEFASATIINEKIII